MEYKNKLNQIKAVLGLNVKLEQMSLDNGTVVEAESFEAGQEIFIVNGEERVALPIGEFIFEDGRLLSVVEEGIIAEVKEAGAPEEEMPPEETPELEAAPEAPTAPKKIVESVSKEIHFSDEQRESLKAELKAEILAELKLSKEEVIVEEVVVELAEEVKPIIASPESTVDKKNVNLYSQKRTGLTMQERVNQTILNYKNK